MASGSLTADEGYFTIEEIAQIQEFDIRTVMGMPTLPASQGSFERPAARTHRAACAVKSQSGKALLHNAECTWNAGLSISLTKADCAEPPSREQKISLSGTHSGRPALI